MWRTNGDGIGRLLRTACPDGAGRIGPGDLRKSSLLGTRIAAGICMLALCAATLTPAGAQSGMKRVTDANNRFSIAFPPRWTVQTIQVNQKVLTTEVPISSLPNGMSSSSVMIAAGPGGDFNTPPILVVAPIDFPRPMSPDDVAGLIHQAQSQNGTSNPNTQVRMTQDGFATIAGQHAYYAYGVAQRAGQPLSLYGVLVYIAQGRTGFVMLGATLNDPNRIKRDFSTISAILETFRIVPRQSMVERLGTSAFAFPDATGGRPEATSLRR